MPKRDDSEIEPLIIDRSAAAEIPNSDAVTEWARGKRVFVSSVMSDLQAERKAAAAAIRAVGAKPVLFEQFGGRDADPEGAYLGEVETSDIYIGILGRRYGKPLSTRFSATHTEYLHAEKQGLRIAVWTAAATDREGHEQSFLEETRVFHVTPEFDSPEDLQRQIEDRLTMIASEDLAPWCKLGNVVFRATHVVDHGNELFVTARVRSDAVAHALEQFRGERAMRGGEARFSWAGRSKYVRVSSVKSTTRAARSREMQLQLEVIEAPEHHGLDMTINNLRPSDLTEAGLRTVLFGEPNPLSDQYLGFAAEIRDPLAAVREAKVSDEITRPLAELLVVDELVGSGRAARVTEFNLGVAIHGIRRLKLSWEVRSRYAGQRVEVRAIEGGIRL
jgi:hypothetical protein